MAFLSLCVVLLALVAAGRFLTFSQPPQQADAFIVLSGGVGRIEKAAELYDAGYAPSVILSNAKEANGSYGDMYETAVALGISHGSILTENSADSSYRNAKFTLPIMQENGFTSAIVVSSDFHMRRVKFNFDRMYKDSGIKLTYVGADSRYNDKWWWVDAYSRETTFSEYVKFIGNAFGYHGPEAKGVLEQIKHWFRSTK